MTEREGTLVAGTIVAERYEISALISAGGMGDVYRARHLLTRRPVALKLMHLGLRERDPDCALRFLREARCAAALRHPHIVDVLDMGEHAGLPFLVMELLEGPTLAQAVEETGALSCERALACLLPIAQALSALHAIGILHRDIKPQNIGFGAPPEQRPLLLDFGLARAAEQGGLTRADQIWGSPRYTAPERAAGLAASPASDLWSLAAVLYFALTGEAPGGRDGGPARSLPVRPVRSLAPSLPGAVAALIDRTLQRDPDRRPSSVAAFAAGLRAAAKEHGIALPNNLAEDREEFGEARDTGPALPATRAPRSSARPLFWGLAAVAIALALIGWGRARPAPAGMRQATSAAPRAVPVAPTRAKVAGLVGAVHRPDAGAVLAAEPPVAPAPRNVARAPSERGFLKVEDEWK